MQLRDYQRDAVAAVERGDEQQVGRQLVVIPTGGGKTLAFSEVIRRRGGTALVLAHRDELIEQATLKLAMVAPRLAPHIGVVKAKRNDVDKRVIVGSVQTLAVARRLAQLPQRFTTVVVDEAHHAVAASYVRILEHVRASGLILGVTATPYRHGKGENLMDVFDVVTYDDMTLEDMIREGWLCDLVGLRVHLERLDLKKVKKKGGDYDDKALGRAMEDAGATRHVVSAWLEHAHSKRTAAFFPTVDLSRKTAAAFVEAGVAAAHVDGTTPADERADMLRRLGTGELLVICNVAVLGEGYDEPSIECILLCTATKSLTKYTQIVGRGTRLHPGKHVCLVIDMAGASDDMTLGVLMDLDDEPRAGETLLQAKDRELAEQADQAGPVAAGTLRLASERRDLFNRDAIQWVRHGTRWVVDGQDGALVVLDCYQPGPAGWRVLLLREDKARGGPSGLIAEVHARGLDLGYAQGVAEQVVRARRAVALADKNAAWRARPASKGQRGMLWHLGVTADTAMTMGEAADAITAARAARVLEHFDRATA